MTSYKMAYMVFNPAEFYFMTPVSWTDSSGVQTVHFPFRDNVASDLASNLWRYYGKRTIVQTTQLGYTKTIVRTPDIAIRSYTETVTYNPSQSAFDSDWTGTTYSFYRNYWIEDIDHDAGTEYHCAGNDGTSTGGNFIFKEEWFYEDLLTESAAFTLMRSVMDTVLGDWSGVSECTELWNGYMQPGMAHVYFTLIPSPGWFHRSVDTYTFTSAITAWVFKRTSVNFGYSAKGYAIKAVSRLGQQVYYLMSLIRMTNAGVCIQSGRTNPASGCLADLRYSEQAAEVIEAAELPQLNPDPFTPSYNTDHWELPSDWQTYSYNYGSTGPSLDRAAAFVSIPFGEGYKSSVAGCTTGTEDRYFKFGALLDLDEDEVDNPCRVSAALETVYADDETITADNEYQAPP